MNIGIVSDTHGMVRECMIKHLDECDIIIHAGDIGNIDVINKLDEINKTIYVRGNCDKSEIFNHISNEQIMSIDGLTIGVVHDISKVSEELINLSNIIIYGHSHKYKIYENNGIIYINPGSVGPKRFKLPTTMAKLNILNSDKVSELKQISEYEYEFFNCELEFIEII